MNSYPCHHHCAYIICLHPSSIAKGGFYCQVILFITIQDYLRTSRGVKLIDWSQPFSTRPPKCIPLYWMWETFEWDHNQCALPVSFMNSKHLIAFRSGMDSQNMNQISLSSSAVLCSSCLSLSFSCLTVGAKERYAQFV